MIPLPSSRCKWYQDRSHFYVSYHRSAYGTIAIRIFTPLFQYSRSICTYGRLCITPSRFFSIANEMLAWCLYWCCFPVIVCRIQRFVSFCVGIVIGRSKIIVAVAWMLTTISLGDRRSLVMDADSQRFKVGVYFVRRVYRKRKHTCAFRIFFVCLQRAFTIITGKSRRKPISKCTQCMWSAHTHTHTSIHSMWYAIRTVSSGSRTTTHIASASNTLRRAFRHHFYKLSKVRTQECATLFLKHLDGYARTHKQYMQLFERVRIRSMHYKAKYHFSFIPYAHCDGNRS